MPMMGATIPLSPSILNLLIAFLIQLIHYYDLFMWGMVGCKYANNAMALIDSVGSGGSDISKSYKFEYFRSFWVPTMFHSSHKYHSTTGSTILEDVRGP